MTDSAGARAHTHGRACRCRDPHRNGHRAHPANHLPGQEPHRAAKRIEWAPQPSASTTSFSSPATIPKAGDQPDTKPVFDVDSKTLLETARRLRDDGALPTGRKVGGKAAFFLGAADLPIDPPAGWQPNGLLGKIKSGAQFAQTQFCMDAAIVRRYVGALERAGIVREFSILIGVNPLRSAKSTAQWMKNHLFGTIIADDLIKPAWRGAADPEHEGIEHLRRTDRGTVDHPRRRRRSHHGAGQRGGDSGSDQGGEEARRSRGVKKSAG